MEEDLRTLAFTDSLTGVNNRRRFFELANKELERTKRNGRPFCFLTLDIDHFKTINDSHGHDQGDIVLTKLAACCLQELRCSDIFGRIGGEEFSAILIETDTETAQIVAERLRKRIAAESIQTDDARIAFTISIGLSHWQGNDDTIDSIMLLFRLILKNAFRHRLRALLTILGVAVALLAFGLLRTVLDAWNSGVAASSANRLVTRNAISMVTTQGQREMVLDAIGAGCAGYILRPYSEETFRKHVLRGCQVERVTEIEEQQIEDAREMVAAGNFDDAIEAFEEIISEQNMSPGPRMPRPTRLFCSTRKMATRPCLMM